MDATVAVLPLPAGETGADRLLRVSWRYLNSYGNVPERDDVKFNVAVKETAIPPDGKAPAASDYPSMDETKGKRFTPVYGEIGISGSAKLIQNASYVGHARWTEPTASTRLRNFRIDLPGTCNRRYLFRILPKGSVSIRAMSPTAPRTTCFTPMSYAIKFGVAKSHDQSLGLPRPSRLNDGGIDDLPAHGEITDLAQDAIERADSVRRRLRGSVARGTARWSWHPAPDLRGPDQRSA